MNKRAFRPRASDDEPQYPTHELVNSDRRAFLEQCGVALAGLTALALAPDLTGLDLGEPQGTRKKKPNKKKKPGRKRPGRTKRPPAPVPGGPRHPPTRPVPVPPKKKPAPKKP